MTTKFLHPFSCRVALAMALILGMFFTQTSYAQTYCPSKGTAPWSEWIAKVQFGTINNTSSKEGYGNFTSQTTTLATGTSYPLSITQGFSYAPDPANATQQGRAWIDYNHNGTFEATELVASFTRTTTTANVLIPTTALTGATRLRISLKTLGAPTACEIFDKGEVEDYTVTITGGTVGTNTCLNTFELNMIPANTCTGTGFPNGGSSATLQQYGSNIADGFIVQARFFNNYTMLLFARNGTTTQPAGTTFSSCPGNWVYFKTYGTIRYRIPRSTDGEVTDFAVRMRSVGNPSNPDTVYLELNSSTFVSVSKKKDCNACYANDVKAPVFTNCPTTVPTVQLATQTIYPFTNSMLNAQLNIRLTDDCPINPSLLLDKPDDGSVLATWGGTQSYKFLAFDSAGHRAVCAFTVRFSNPICNGVAPPTIVNCPANVNIRVPTTQDCGIATWQEPTVSSTVPATIFLQSNYGSGFCFPIGTTPVIYTAKDTCGNTSKCNFNVTVTQGTGNCTNDVTPPVITNCPANQEKQAVDNSCSVFSWNVPTATDLCTPPTLSFVSKRGSAILFQSNTSVSVNICPPNNIDTIVYTARDGAGNTATCQFRLNLKPPTTSTPDMSISMTTTPSVYKRFSPHNFRVIAINSGTTAFTNVKIKFTRPASTVSGGAKVASIGTFRDFCAGGIECSEWTIPTLAAGVTATLDAPVFILAPTGTINANATLLSSTPTDNIVGNNATNIAVEPAPIAVPLIIYKPTQLIPVVIQKVHPTVTESEIDVELESLIDKTIEFDISNAMGQTVLVQQLAIEKGLNKVAFDVSQLPQGLYLIQTNVGKGRSVPTKFIKM